METSELKQKIKKFIEDLGMDETASGLFALGMQDMLSKFLQELILQSFTDDELEQIELEANKQDILEEEKPLLISELFAAKNNGKTLQDMSAQFLYDFLLEIKKQIELSRKLLEKVNGLNLSESEKLMEIKKYMEILVEKNIKSINNSLTNMTL